MSIAVSKMLLSRLAPEPTRELDHGALPEIVLPTRSLNGPFGTALPMYTREPVSLGVRQFSEDELVYTLVTDGHTRLVARTAAAETLLTRTPQYVRTYAPSDRG